MCIEVIVCNVSVVFLRHSVEKLQLMLVASLKHPKE